MKGGFMPFHCDYAGNHNASRLCLFGSSCVVIDQIPNPDALEFCACPPGYYNDYTLFHFPNCGMPVPVFAVLFGIVTVVTIISLAFSGAVILELRSSTRRLLTVGSLAILALWLIMLSVWIEQGHFAAANFFLVLANSLISRCQVDATLIFAMPIYALVREDINKLKRVLLGIEGFSNVSRIVLGAIMISITRDVDPNSYNTVMVVYLFVFAVCSSTLTVSTIMAAHQLISNIRSHVEMKDDAKLKAVLSRLKKFKVTLFWILLLGSTLFLIPVVALVLKSIPGQFAIDFSLQIIPPILFAQIAHHLRTKGNISDSKTLSATSNDRPRVQDANPKQAESSELFKKEPKPASHSSLVPNLSDPVNLVPSSDTIGA